ncbi:hypothetical protein, partial [Mesorhizobium sp.]|uniref:hypothetical protein n=1 Tax=Mesorhizobium sp. TaxID=1871066 RepID=UPI0025C04FC8
LLNLSFGCSRSVGTTFELTVVRRQELPAKIDAVMGEVEIPVLSFIVFGTERVDAPAWKL